jgi:hypothetical protein
MHFVRLIFLIIIAQGLFGCSKSTASKKTPVIGHAITGLYNPQRIYKDNTKEAFDYALLFETLGGVEIDVQLSQDGSLWLYHDTDLSFQTNTSGSVYELTDEQLGKVVYSTLQGEKLIKINDLSVKAVEPHFRLYIDLKDYNYRSMDSSLTAKIIDELHAFKTANPHFSNSYIILPDLAFLQQFEQAGFENLYTDISGLVDGLAKKNDYPSLTGAFVRNGNIDKSAVKTLQDNELKIVIFDMRTIFSIRRALAKNPDEIMVEEFRTALKEL